MVLVHVLEDRQRLPQAGAPEKQSGVSDGREAWSANGLARFRRGRGLVPVDMRLMKGDN